MQENQIILEEIMTNPQLDVKVNAKTARETLRGEIRKLGKQIKVLERDNPKNLSHSQKARKLNFLRKRATLIGMAIALYHNRVHSRSITVPGDKLYFSVPLQADYLSSAALHHPSNTFFGSKNYLSTTQKDCVLKIVDWHDYKQANPKSNSNKEASQSFIIDLGEALKNSLSFFSKKK